MNGHLKSHLLAAYGGGETNKLIESYIILKVVSSTEVVKVDKMSVCFVCLHNDNCLLYCFYNSEL